MGVQDLQTFLQSSSLEGASVLVDLLKVARNVSQRQQPHNTNRRIKPITGNKLKLIVDAENCLDRLYGGFFSDWACGGQWNRMVQFLSILTGSLSRGNIELAIVLNGTIEQCRMDEWIQKQAETRQRVGSVLKHINTKGTPPPKIWWTAPVSLRSALRMALRHLNVIVMCTMDDHHQEVIAYCREYGFHGLLADDAEYAAFDPPRYFSSEQLKLTYKGSIETKEYRLSVLTKALNLTQEQICVMTALLGNFLLPETELQELHKRIGLNLNRNGENVPEINVKALAKFVSQLPPVSEMDALVRAVFGNLEDPRASRFRQSVQYYLNGTASGFLKYCAPASTNKQNNRQKQQQPNPQQVKEKENNNTVKEDADLLPINNTGFASETSEQQQETLQTYNLLTANSILSTEFDGLTSILSQAADMLDPEHLPPTALSGVDEKVNGVSNGSSPLNSNESVNGGPSSAKITLAVNQNKSNKAGASATPSPRPAKPKKSKSKSNANIVAPTVSADVLRTASLRHQKGLMAPVVLHVLSAQEVRLPCLMEDEANREFPAIHEIYKLLRKRIYAVLFNLHHLRYVHSNKQKNGDVAENALHPDVIVKEWVYSRSNPYLHPEEVKAEPLPWAVPTLQRLWFGPSVDDKRRRMRAFLSCLDSDTPLILNTAYVPQHMLIMACVLRYIMSQEKPIMRRNELDAFICHAFNPNLMNVQYLQEMTLNVVSSRGVQLAALFMEGVEMAIIANDACGAPLPWLMCCPWLYFDGKLFHYTLARSTQAKNILDICDNYIERVVKVERMRKAILEGLDAKFAKVPMPHYTGLPLMRHYQSAPPSYTLPALNLSAGRGSVPGLRGRPLPSRGGQLQVAGVVVGSWGANYGYQTGLRQQILPAGMSLQPPRGRGRNYGGGYMRGGRGQNKQGMPTYATSSNRRNQSNRSKKSNKNKEKKDKENKANKGLSLTVKTENGDVPVNEVNETNDEKPLNDDKGENCPEAVTGLEGQGDAPNLVKTTD